MRQDHDEYAEIISVNGFKELYNEHDKWVKGRKTVLFRGQSNAHWELKTSLDRFSKICRKNGSGSQKIESFLLEEFQRRYHNYSSRIPKESNRIEWWALMQHYGAPTRLFDWTYSFYVAIFFAVEDLESKKKSAVWAIDADWLKKKLREHKKLSKFLTEDLHLAKKKSFEEFNDKSIVLRICPHQLHERLSIQQGSFLTVGRITESFIQNLIDFAGSKMELKKYLCKFVIQKSNRIRKDILEDLYRMNISRASLFPGLDGFAASLKTIGYAMPNLLQKNLEHVSN